MNEMSLCKTINEIHAIESFVLIVVGILPSFRLFSAVYIYYLWRYGK